MLGAALYGLLAPLVLRPGPFVPPRSLVPAFAVVVAYLAYRFVFLPRPTYVQAKFSEWPELCFAGAVALSACNTLSRLPRGRAPGEARLSSRNQREAERWRWTAGVAAGSQEVSESAASS